jgi:hypothetical protein
MHSKAVDFNSSSFKAIAHADNPLIVKALIPVNSFLSIAG